MFEVSTVFLEEQKKMIVRLTVKEYIKGLEDKLKKKGFEHISISLSSGEYNISYVEVCEYYSMHFSPSFNTLESLEGFIDET